MKKKSASARPKPSRLQSATRRRVAMLYGGMFIVLSLVSISIYVFIIYPHAEASRYTQNLQQGASNLRSSLVKLASTTQSAVFNDPDGTSAQHVKDLVTISTLITDTHAHLLTFQQAADSLSPRPQLPFFNSYHDAQIGKRHAADIVSQTDDVLTQYAQLATFLKQYYSLDNTFVTLTTQINDVGNLDNLIPSAYEVYGDGQTLAKTAATVNNLRPPPGYTPLLTRAANIYKQAAQGFDTLAYGLSINYDPYKNSGINLVEQAANQHDDTLIDIPTNLDQTSYILTQVNELPDKTDSILTAKTSGD